MASIHPPVCHADTVEVIRRAFNGARSVMAAIPLPGGQINATSLVILDNGERVVLRAAPFEVDTGAGPSWLSSTGLRREAAAIAAMPGLAHLLPVTVAHEFGPNFLGRDWVLQQVMPGVPLSTIDATLEPEAREGIWREIGAFARRMHDHTCSAFGPPGETTHNRWSAFLAQDVAGLLDDARRFGLPIPPFERLARLVHDHASTLDDVGPPALIHSDLLPPHLFVADDDDGVLHLAGVIDLEFARYADRASEQLLPGSGFGYVPPDMHHPFLDGYGTTEQRPGHEFRGAFYQALDLGWNASLLGFQQADATDLVGSMEDALHKATSRATRSLLDTETRRSD